MMTDFTYCKKNILYPIAICLEELWEKLDCIPYAFINQIEMSQDSQKVNGNPPSQVLFNPNSSLLFYTHSRNNT